MTLTGNETKKDLLKIATKLEITEVNEKTKNDDIIELIKAHADYEEEYVPTLDELDDEDVPGIVKTPTGNIIEKTTSRREDKQLFNEATVKAIITDHDNTVTIENDQEGRLFSFSWGNMYSGVIQEKVRVDGHATPISRGGIRHLETIKIPQNYTGTDGKPKVRMVKRFTINVVDGWTPEQLQELKKKQLAVME